MGSKPRRIRLPGKDFRLLFLIHDRYTITRADNRCDILLRKLRWHLDLSKLRWAIFIWGRAEKVSVSQASVFLLLMLGFPLDEQMDVSSRFHKGRRTMLSVT